MWHSWLEQVGHSWFKWVGHSWLERVGHLWLKWVGHSWHKWVGHLWQSELLFFGRYAQKNTGLQGSTLSGSSHRMIMGFGPFDSPARDLLERFTEIY